MRCALVELNECHGEVLPTFVHLLNRLAGDVDVYLRRQVLESGPFERCPRLRYRARVLECAATRARLKLRGFAGYDLVVATSVEPKPVLRRLARVSTPVVGVIHNALLLDEDPEYRAFFGRPGRRALTLARHVADGCPPDLGARWVAPVFVMAQPEGRSPDWRRFCVQGRIDFKRRNYWSLLEAVSQLPAETRSEIEVLLLGGDRDLDGLRLRRAIREHGLEPVFRQPQDAGFSYARALEGIASSGFLLPLVDTTSPLFAPYFQDKISSSVSMALGVGRIPILHQRLADRYGLGSPAISYGDGGLGAAMGRALELEADARGAMVNGLHARRRELLEVSLDNLRMTLGELGLPRSSS
jgi:hypothetical protein